VSSLQADRPGTELNLAGFSEDTRENIYENRSRFLSMFDRPYRLALAWQVHGNDVRVVTEARGVSDSDERADAVISDLEGVLAGVKTADCVPVLIADTQSRAYAAVHAGWRGTADGVVKKVIERMDEGFGSSPKDLVCAIGPAAGCDAYEVGAEVIDIFEKASLDGSKYFRPTREGHALADIKLANHDQLTASGVNEANIFISPLCTIERTDLFFSYRIEKKRYGKTGRLLSVIGRA
jgi:YfiH family protein